MTNLFSLDLFMVIFYPDNILMETSSLYVLWTVESTVNLPKVVLVFTAKTWITLNLGIQKMLTKGKVLCLYWDIPSLSDRYYQLDI